eukprot:Sdes_comp10169_c0_seq1m1784
MKEVIFEEFSLEKILSSPTEYLPEDYGKKTLSKMLAMVRYWKTYETQPKQCEKFMAECKTFIRFHISSENIIKSQSGLEVLNAVIQIVPSPQFLEFLKTFSIVENIFKNLQKY